VCANGLPALAVQMQGYDGRWHRNCFSRETCGPTARFSFMDRWTHSSIGGDYGAECCFF
jgi:hypothetical protein